MTARAQVMQQQATKKLTTIMSLAWPQPIHVSSSLTLLLLNGSHLGQFFEQEETLIYLDYVTAAESRHTGLLDHTTSCTWLVGKEPCNCQNEQHFLVEKKSNRELTNPWKEDVSRIQGNKCQLRFPSPHKTHYVSDDTSGLEMATI